MARILRGFAVGACLIGFASACSHSSAPRGTVQGKVTLDGLPLTNASIYFESDATKTSIVSTLGPDGEFEVQTHAAKGLPPGTYKVAITPGAVLDPAAPPVLAGQKAPKSAELPNIPEKYRTTATSGLSADVREGENAPFSFALVK